MQELRSTAERIFREESGKIVAGFPVGDLTNRMRQLHDVLGV